MTDYEFMRIVLSNLFAAIIFGSFVALIFYMGKIQYIHNPSEKKHRLMIGVIGIFMCILLSICLIVYGKVVYIPIR